MTLQLQYNLPFKIANTCLRDIIIFFFELIQTWKLKNILILNLIYPKYEIIPSSQEITPAINSMS